ncbi:MAG: hypothetical protein Q9183_002092 [Haloplaca sp. 2 TL-2023]
MPPLNFDILTLIFEEILRSNRYRRDSRSALSPVSRVCRLWRSAAVPLLFQKIQISLISDDDDDDDAANECDQLLDFCQASPYRDVVRELHLRGTKFELPDRCIDVLIKSIALLPRLAVFGWFLLGNIRKKLLGALDKHKALLNTHVWLYPDQDHDFFDIKDWNLGILSLAVDGPHYATNDCPATAMWPPRNRISSLDKKSPQVPQDYTFADPWRNHVSTKTPESRGVQLDSLVLYRQDVRRWRKSDLRIMTDIQKVKRLSLVNCDWLYRFPWHHCPDDLDVLEIIDPLQAFAIRSDSFIKDFVIAHAMARFTTLRVLNIQNVGGPVCELLWALAVDGKGKGIKELRLHDQDIKGVDRFYRFRREELDCPFTKLLAHICPDVETLSIDIAAHGLDHDAGEHFERRQGPTVCPWAATLVEMAQTPTLSISETFRSLDSLHSLRIRTSASGREWDDRAVLGIAEKMGAESLDEFRFVVAEPMNRHLTELRGEIYNCTKFVEEADGMEWCVQPANGEPVIVSRPAIVPGIDRESSGDVMQKDTETPWWMHLARLRRLTNC